MSQTEQYSAVLSNEDLRPATDRSWNWYNMFTFWMTSVHSMAGYVVAASFFTLGISSWQVLISLMVAMSIVLVMANLAAKPGQLGGVPYAVVSRQAFGVFGAIIPSVIRGIIAFCWYGIQTYLASHALLLCVLRFFPSLQPMVQVSFLGLSELGWICFLVVWALQAFVFWHGMETIKKFMDFAGPAVYVVMFILAGWIVYKVGFNQLSFSFSSKQLTTGQQIHEMVKAVVLLISFYLPQLLTFADFSRYCKSYQDVKRGNLLGLPINYLVFALICVTIVSGTIPLFGEMITDPIETVARIDHDVAVALGVLTMIIATIGVNIVANFVSSAFDFSNCNPRKISFRTGGLIAAIGSLIITPWNLFNSPEIIHYTLDALAVFIAPLYGILIMDFYLTHKSKLNVDALFTDSPEGVYWYNKGFNLRTIKALGLSVVIGLIITFTPSLKPVADFNSIIGIATGSLFYYLINRSLLSAKK